ncbi:MAG: invasin domain 3-containing protein [bacterium]
MARRNPVERWLLSLWALALVVGMVWITCTQKIPIDPTQSLQEDVPLLTDVSASPSQIAVGGAQSEIRVRLVNQQGQPMSEKVITFSTDQGSVTLENATDQDGWARTTLVSGQTGGQATITIRYGKLASATVSVLFISSTQAQIQISTEKNSILANGIDETAVTVTVLSDSGKAVEGAAVSLSTTMGVIPATVMTDKDGKGQVALRSSASSTDGSSTVTASYNSYSVAVVVFFKGIQMVVGANPTSILADGKSSSAITAIVKETTSQIAVSNASVVFSTDLGLIPNEMMTDSRGVAQVTLTSGTVAGTAHVTALFGELRSATLNVACLPVTAGQFVFSEMAANPSTLLANGEDKATVSVKVIDENRNAVAGDSVQFQSTVGIIQPVWGVTDGGGVATAVLTARASREDSIAIVTVSRRGGIQSTSIPVAFQGVQMELSASQQTIVADGQSTSEITVVIKRTSSLVAISDARILFGTNLGTIPNETKTGADGTARVRLTSGTTTGTAHVIVTYGSTHRDTVDVNFVTQAPATRTLSEISISPVTILANGVDQSTISAKVLGSDLKPVSGVVVGFTTTAGQISAQAVTNENGLAVVQLVSAASKNNIIATVTAQLGTQSLQSNVTFVGVTMDVSASPTMIIANGQSTSSIRVVLKRTVSKVAVSGAEVSLSTDLGTIPSAATTNSAGVASADLTSAATTGTAHVLARYGNTISDTVNVIFDASVPTFIEVSATPPVIPADGQSQSLIKATVSDANRNPIPDGSVVMFNIIEGSGTIVRQKTTVGGVASSALTSGTVPDTARVAVSIAGLADTVDVVYTVGTVNQILVSADRDSMAADGIATAKIQAKVLDGQGNSVQGVTVVFSTSIGDITPSAQTNAQGVAEAQFSSGRVGVATITATVTLSGGSVSGIKTIRLLPGEPNSIVLRFDPTSIGVKDTGQEQTAIVEAEVRDSKNNPVVDGTLVEFSILHGPGGGESLSSSSPIPTVGGIARVSLSSGTVSGNVRVQAKVTAKPIVAIAAEILIHAGEAFIENILDQNTTHMTIAANRLNIWMTLDTTTVSIMVLDKYNNPVQKGTAVYLTTSGGGINTHTAYTDAYGKANVTLTAGNPQPTIGRFYNYSGMQDPNIPGKILPGYQFYPTLADTLIPNFDAYPDAYYPGTDGGRILNSAGNLLENDGISRIMAYTEGKDASGNPARAWDWLAVVYSGPMQYFADNSYQSVPDVLHPGQSATVQINIMDANGNPIASGSSIKAEMIPADAQAMLSWTDITTGNGQGTSYYYITIQNAINPDEPKPGYAGIKITVNSVNGKASLVTKSTYISGS